MRIIMLICLILLSNNIQADWSKTVWRLIGTFVGTSVGIMVGKELSPNDDSIKLNKVIGGSIGAGAGFFAGDYLATKLYEENPENYQGPDILPTKKNISGQESVHNSSTSHVDWNQLITLKDLRPTKIYNSKPSDDLPSKLKNQVKLHMIKEFTIPPRKFEGENGNTYHFMGGTIIEHSYINQ
jgi:hypothetical protein